MHSFAVSRNHLRHPRIDLLALVRDVVIVVAVVLSAAAVTASERIAVHGAESAGVEKSARVANAPLDVEVLVGALGASAIVHGLDLSALNTVSLMNEQGEAIVRSLAETALRFDDVPAGRYHILVSSEGPITHVEGATISSAIVVRSEAFSLATVGDVVLESR